MSLLNRAFRAFGSAAASAPRRIVDWFANKRWLVWVGIVTTAGNIAVAELEALSGLAVEIQGTDLDLITIAPLVAAWLGQRRANSNRYVEELRDAVDELREAEARSYTIGGDPHNGGN